MLHRDGDSEKVFTFHYEISAAHPPRLPDGERYGNDGRYSDDQGELPVPLQGPQDHGVELKQEERIQPLQILHTGYLHSFRKCDAFSKIPRG